MKKKQAEEEIEELEGLEDGVYYYEAMIEGGVLVWALQKIS